MLCRFVDADLAVASRPPASWEDAMTAVTSLLTRYASKIAGVLHCYDRVIVSGTLLGLCHAEGMSRYLTGQGVRLFDYPKFAEQFREEIRANAERLAQEAGITIEHVRSPKAFRKEDRIKALLAERGTTPGLVHIFSAMESCPAFYPWHNKQTGETGLRHKESQCLHYYFYFIDPVCGLCYLRVPTWLPCRLQFYCNGHNWLAGQLRKAGLAFTQVDNTFTAIADWAAAQALADQFSPQRLQRALDRWARHYCPVVRHVPGTYHWSLHQVEFATDIVFKRPEDLRPLYETLIRLAIHTVQPAQIAGFLGRKLDPRYQGELGTDFRTRPYGTCLKHYMGWAALKLYDKFGLVLRIETTINDVSELKHYRTVEHRDGTRETKYAPMQKTIYSLAPLRELLLAANARYLAFLSELTDTSGGLRDVEGLGHSVTRQGRSYRGFNLFCRQDLAILLAVLRGEGMISGITNRMIRRACPGKTSAHVSYLLKRCRVHGLLKKCGHHFKYYLTQTGKHLLLTALKLRALIVIPTMAGLEQV